MRGEFEFLIATTFARGRSTSPWTGHGEDVFLGVEFIDGHLKPLTTLTPKPSTTTTIFQTMSKLFGITIGSVKPFEFGFGITAEAFLKPSFACLTDGHRFGVVKVAGHEL